MKIIRSSKIFATIGDIEFIESRQFSAALEANSIPDAFVQQLESVLSENPELGDIIQGTGGARKIRMQVTYSKGKRGGGPSNICIFCR